MENKDFKFSKVRFFVIFFLILIGIGMCVELSLIFYKTNFLTNYQPSFCVISDLIDCDSVSTTEYALTLGIPNALWGLILYSTMLMLLFVDRIQAKFKNSIFNVFQNPRSYIAILGVLSFIVSIILAFVSIYVIKKICILCFCTYFINLFIAIAARSKKGFINDLNITIVDFLEGVKNHFVLFLFVTISATLTLYYCNQSLVFSPVIKKMRSQKEFYEMKINKYFVKSNTLGKKNSPVIVRLYSDFNCPYCKVMNNMLHKAARHENIYVEEINFPLDVTCNPQIGRTLGGHEASCIYSQYALAAKKQDRYWGMVNLMFNYHPKSFEEMAKYSKEMKLGLDMEQLKMDANSPEVLKELSQEIQMTHNKNIYATPTIEINGKIHLGAMTWEDLIKNIHDAHMKIKKFY